MTMERAAGPGLEPAPAPGPGQASGGTDAAAEARRLQILATEHWSLLATRSLTYNESFNRVSMFLSVLSGAVVALALVSQADHFGDGFRAFALLLLPVVLFTGIATYIRVVNVNMADLLWLAGMNRLRHAYLEAEPDLARYFISGSNDDMRGIAITGGFPVPSGRGQSLRGFGHALTTVPGMLAVIVAVVAGALGALGGLAIGLAMAPSILAGAVAFGAVMAALNRYGYRSFSGMPSRLRVEFPSEPPAASSPLTETAR